MSESRSYRPDIDGLRAIAVLAVIAHHLNPNIAPGGFLGVDVFFVISGYLIAGNIGDAIRAGNFSLVDFWGRRAKRLVPVLLLVLACSAAIAESNLSTYQLRMFWASFGSAALSVANIFFWRNTDYFSPEAAHQPLLHTWSLGVEEQFYFLFPLLALVLAGKGKLQSKQTWLAMLLVTLIFALFLWHWRPVAAFYLLPARAIELLVGAYAALFSVKTTREANTSFFSDKVSAIVLLLLAGLLFAPQTLNAHLAMQIGLTVACSTWLVARGDRGGITDVLLARWHLPLIGRASYSLYLWHLPVLVLGPIFLPASPALLIPLIAILGLSSHFLVEKPVRYASWLTTRTAVSLSLALMLACAGYAYLRYIWFGLLRPPTAQQLAILSNKYDYAQDYELGTCFLEPGMGLERLQECQLPGKVPKLGRVLVWGDSHAAHLLPGLKQSTAHWQSLTHWAVAGCTPLLGSRSRYRADCADINERLMERVATLRPRTVVLAGDWLEAERRPLAQTVDRLKTLNVAQIIIVGPVPRWSNPLPYLVATAATRLHDMPTWLASGLEGRVWGLDEALRREADSLGINYVSALSIFCSDGGCQTRATTDSLELTSWDQAHLNPMASRKLVDALTAHASASLTHKFGDADFR